MTDVLYDKNDVGRNEKLLKSMRPGTGRRIKEDFSVVNIADLFDTDEEGNLFLRVTLIGGGGGNSPLTTKGDLYTYGTSDKRLPVGVNGQILSADSTTATGLKWVNPVDVGAIWGSITGTLANQTDLVNALGLKANLTGATFSGSISATNLSGTNTGDEDATSIKTKLGITTLSGSNTGDQDLSGKQDVLISATNIKSINGNSILGAGDLTISGGVPYSGASSDVDLGNYDLVATELHASSLIQANKLGTASAGTPVYNSSDLISESSAWNTTSSLAETWKWKWRNIPVSGAGTSAIYKLYVQQDAGAETQVCYFTTNALFISQINASGSAPFVGNGLYPYNSTFLQLRGRSVNSGTSEQIRFGHVSTQTLVENGDLITYYSDNNTTRIGGVDDMYGFSYQRKGVKQTTDATQQAITLSNGTNGNTSVLTTETGKIYQVHAKVVGKQGTTNVAGVDIYATIKNVGGVASVVGNIQQVAPNQSAGDWGTAGTFATFTLSGADVRVSVQGKAGTTIDWKMAMDFIAY